MARVIRSGARVVSRLEVQAAERAAAIVERAEQQAEALRASIHRQVTEQARDEARAELAALRIETDRARTDAIRAVRRSVETLAIAIARKLVEEDLVLNPTRVRATVDAALARIPRATRVVVRVHPSDVARLDLAVELLPDPSLEPGDCVVESDLGQVDARLQTKLDRLLDALRSGRETRDE